MPPPGRELPAKTNLFATTPATPVEIIILLHALVYINKGKERECPNLKSWKNRAIGDRIAFAVQIIVKTWGHLSEKLNVADFQELIGPYMLFEQIEKIFKPLRTAEDGIAPAKQSITLRGIFIPATKMSDCEATVWNRRASFAKALRAISAIFRGALQPPRTDPALQVSPGRTLGVFGEICTQRRSAPGAFLDFAAVFYRSNQLDRQNGNRSPRGDCHSTQRQYSLLETFVSRSDVRVTSLTAQPGALDFKVATAAPLEALRGTRKRRVEDMTQADVVLENRESPRTPTLSDNADFQHKFRVTTDTVLEYMMPFCRIHDFACSDLEDTDSLDSEEDLSGKVKLILTDPSISTEALQACDLEEVVSMFNRLPMPGEHGIIWTNAEQHSIWLKLLIDVKQLGEEVEEIQDSKAFSADQAPLILLRKPGVDKRNPAASPSALEPVLDLAVHFWKTGEKNAVMATTFDSGSSVHVVSKYLLCANCIDNIPGLEGEHVTMDIGEGKDEALRSSHKNLSLLKELFCRYTKPHEIVFDCFGGTSTTAKPSEAPSFCRLRL